MSLYAQGLTTGKVIDCGDGMFHNANTQTIVRLKKETDDLYFLINEKGRIVADVQQDLEATRD